MPHGGIKKIEFPESSGNGSACLSVEMVTPAKALGLKERRLRRRTVAAQVRVFVCPACASTTISRQGGSDTAQLSNLASGGSKWGVVLLAARAD